MGPKNSLNSSRFSKKKIKSSDEKTLKQKVYKNNWHIDDLLIFISFT